MDETLSKILNWVSSYGYTAVFLGTVIDNSGIQIFLVGASILASLGYLKISVVILLGIIASFTGDQIWYWLGRWNRHNIMNRWKLPGKLRETIIKTEDYYLEYGRSVIIWGRILSGVGKYLPAMAGIYNFPFRKFSLYSIIGSAWTSVLFGSIGFLFGYSCWNIVNRMRIYNVIFICIVMGLVILIILTKRGRRG